MKFQFPTTPRVAIIGGGISGLAAACRLVELAPSWNVTLFEGNSKLGGALQTVERKGFLIERGADSFITNLPWAFDLCRRIGFDQHLISTNQSYRGAYVVRQGRMYKLPAGFQLMVSHRVWPLLTSPLLSFGGRVRLACERFVPAKRDRRDESVAQFARRRLGQEAFERLVEPLVASIYTSDTRRLSVAATMPQFVEMERQWGSLTRGARRGSEETSDSETSGARYGLFMAPRAGMSSLVRALADSLPEGSARIGTEITRLEPRDRGGCKLTFRGTGQCESFDGVIVSVPAPQTARLFEGSFQKLANELYGIEYASSAVVAIGFQRDQISHALEGFGFVVPSMEKRTILAASFASIKFAGRAPPGTVLIRVFVGGALRPDMAEREDRDLTQRVLDELRPLIGLRGDPIVCDITRWRSAMPQYRVGHLERVARIEQRIAGISGLELAGNAYRGVGIPHAVCSGEQAAERLHVTLEKGLSVAG